MKKVYCLLALFIVFCSLQGTSQINKDEAGSYQLYLTQVAAAEAFFQLNKISTANNYLNACDEKFRDIEWKFLKKALDQSQNTISHSGKSYFTDIKFSPDGKNVAAACSDSLIYLYNYPEMKLKNYLKGHMGSVSTIAFSSDGTKLVSGGRDHCVIVWDIATEKELMRNCDSFSQGIFQVRFTPDDKEVGVVSWEKIPDRKPFIFGFAKVIDAISGKVISSIELDNHPAAGIVFTPDGNNLIASTWGEVVYSYNKATSKLNWKYDLAEPSEYNAFHAIDISPDGKTIALGSADHRVHILDTDSGKLIHRIEPWMGHTKLLKSVRFSNDGTKLATAGDDQTILIWNTNNFSKEFSLTGHVNTVYGLCWAPDGNTLISSSLDETMKKWDLSNPFERQNEICDFGPWQTPVSNDGSYFAAPCSDKKLMIYDAASGVQLSKLGEQSALCGDFSKSGKYLVTGDFDGIVRLWDVSSSRELQQFKGHSTRVDGVAYLESKGQLLSVGDTTLRVWGILSQKAEAVISFREKPFRIDVTPDEKFTLIAFGNGTVRILDNLTMKETGGFNCDESIQEITINHDGKSVAVFSGKNIELWDIHTQKRLQLLQGHEKSGYGVGFSPDGTYLISGAGDQTFKFWNLKKGICTFTFHAFEDVIYSCKFISKNRIMLSSSQGQIWHYVF